MPLSEKPGVQKVDSKPSCACGLIIEFDHRPVLHDQMLSFQLAHLPMYDPCDRAHGA
jgi:hypothetical protein